jgi:hypothetical protein
LKILVVEDGSGIAAAKIAGPPGAWVIYVAANAGYASAWR